MGARRRLGRPSPSFGSQLKRPWASHPLSFFFFLQLQVTSSVIFDSGVQGMVLRRLYGLRRGPRVLWPPPGTAHGYHGTRTACPALRVTASGPSRHGPRRLLALPCPRPVAIRPSSESSLLFRLIVLLFRSHYKRDLNRHLELQVPCFEVNDPLDLGPSIQCPESRPPDLSWRRSLTLSTRPS